MPSIEQNLAAWDKDYDWELGGEPWSIAWGGSAAQWHGWIYPRLASFLPVQSILEIAPGFGRWTSYLIDNCESLTAVDVSAKCVEACRERFSENKKVRFEVNDGRSLPMVPDSSIDFAFSFDSLVHVESDVLSGYLRELTRVLRPGGIAFLHHSNYGAYQRSARALAPLQSSFDRLPSLVRAVLLRAGAYRATHMRAVSVTAKGFAQMSETAGLRCVGQELVNWEGGVLLLDCMSLVTRPDHRRQQRPVLVKNRLFRMEARAIRRSRKAYDIERSG